MEWEKLKADLFSAFEDYSKAVFRGSKFIKIVLIIGGALAVAISLGIDVAHANKEISAWTMLGLFGAGAVALGSIFDAVRETDASRAIALAHRAIENADQRGRELDEVVEEFDRFDDAVTRGLDLYNSMDVMRGAIEQSLDLPEIHVPTVIQTCLSAAENSLLGAFDFAVKDLWTICVFMAQPEKESDKVMLRCVAHLRKIPCDLSATRAWPEGVGVAGIAYSMNKEIIIKDMASPDTVVVFDLRNMGRDYDKARYASMVAVPITVGSSPRPWGVAVATSDQNSHFSPEESYGVATTEPVRAIAAMTALAVKAVEAAKRQPPKVASEAV